MDTPEPRARAAPAPLGLGASLDRPTRKKSSPSVRDIIRAEASRAAKTLHASMAAQQSSSTAGAPSASTATFAEQHARITQYLALKPQEGPALSRTTKFEALVEIIPALKTMLDSSSALRDVLKDPQAFEAVVKAATNGGRGLDEVVMNYSAEFRAAGARAKEDLELVQRARDELALFNAGMHGGTYTPNATLGLPVESTAEEDEAYLVSLDRGGENEETPMVMDLYFSAHAKRSDVMMPFAFMLVGSMLAATGMKLTQFALTYGVCVVLLSVAYRHARMQWSYWRNRRDVGTQSAMFVQALLVVCAMQFFIVYMPLWWTSEPLITFITGTAFFITPYLFYKTYATGPGFCPTAASDFDSWSQTMERVSQTMGGRNVAENASRMMAQNRYCKTCHAARPLRSKHCPLCNRCVHKLDHHCPISMCCIGAKNQRFFLSAISCMFIGQLGFLHFSYKYIHMLVDMHGARTRHTGLVNTLASLGRAVNDAPWASWLWFLQIFCTLYCFIILARMYLGVASNLTVNEMINTAKYEYLKTAGDDGEPRYRNIFDAGARINCLHFWRDVDHRRDWDGFYAAAKSGQADLPIAPKYSYSWFHATASKTMRNIFCIHRDVRAVPAPPSGHSHAHGTVQHMSDSHGHGHSHGGTPCDAAHAV